MSKPHSSFGRTLRWGLVCIALAVAVAVELTSGNDVRLSPQSKEVTKDVVVLEKTVLPADLPPLSEFDETIERPLFHPTRRPVLSAATAQPNRPPSSLPGGYSLRGIVMTPAGRTALFQTQRDDEYLRVKKGEAIEGWTIDEINPDHVLVRQNDVVETWKFEHKPQPVRPASRTVRNQPVPQPNSAKVKAVSRPKVSGPSDGIGENQVPAPGQEGQPVVTK